GRRREAGPGGTDPVLSGGNQPDDDAALPLPADLFRLCAASGRAARRAGRRLARRPAPGALPSLPSGRPGRSPRPAADVVQLPLAGSAATRRIHRTIDHADPTNDPVDRVLDVAAVPVGRVAEARGQAVAVRRTVAAGGCAGGCRR